MYVLYSQLSLCQAWSSVLCNYGYLTICISSPTPSQCLELRSELDDVTLPHSTPTNRHTREPSNDGIPYCRGNNWTQEGSTSVLPGNHPSARLQANCSCTEDESTLRHAQGRCGRSNETGQHLLGHHMNIWTVLRVWTVLVLTTISGSTGIRSTDCICIILYSMYSTLLSPHHQVFIFVYVFHSIVVSSPWEGTDTRIIMQLWT